ncbi:MAG TPA: MtnX-like HAD-IB family phosphatase [Pyrinomonadaceae bacterium]|jgi:2,3-diketo-5-methylthio-1-phosphopentane phosphatase
MNPNFYLTEIFSESISPILFLDFDGTVSRRDVIDAILEEFADERWLETEEEWLAGKIGSRECLHRQFSFVQAAPEELNEFLDTLELDEGFLPLLRFCSESGVAVHIVSDGFENYIRRMIQKASLNPPLAENVKVWSNRLIPHSKNRWRTVFPYFEKVCADGCATCKPAVMRLNNFCDAPSIFVGDGLSDRFAAQTANVVFAKKKLADFCLQNRIPQTAYNSLKQVAESLDQAYETFALTLSDKRRSWLEAA